MPSHNTKYIFVLGGGYSGLGKGIVVASIARLLQNFGFSVCTVKIDPYFNFGAGDQNPNEHGEVFVTEDGGEIDEDFGHYERFLAIPCKKKQNITSGKVFYNVIERGKLGGFLGKNIQLIPHVRNEVKDQIRNSVNKADFAVIEVGGTIGDDEALVYYRAISSMIYEDKEDAIVVVLVPLVFNEAVGEPKTKIAQNAIRELNALGIRTDFMVVRTDFEDFLDEKRKEKLYIFCNIPKENIIPDPSIDSPYRLPFVFNKEKFGEKILNKFNLKSATINWQGYENFIRKLDSAHDKISIAYVGKYVVEGKGIHKDAYISVEEALKRACIEFGFLPEFHRINAEMCEKDVSVLEKVKGIIIPGGYGARGFEGKINAIKFARENKIPYLGLCLGLQLAVIEFARNVCGLENAHSDEMDEDCKSHKNHNHVICILTEQEKIRNEQGYIGTQRLGDFTCAIENNFIKKLYETLGRPDEVERSKIEKYESFRVGNLKENDFVVFERHRHRREVNPEFLDLLLKNRMRFEGIHRALDDTILVEIISLENHPFFVASQFHPEFSSNYLRPNPLFYGFAKAVNNFI